MDTDKSSTSNTTTDTLIASQIGAVIRGDFITDDSYRAIIENSNEDILEALRSKPVGVLELDDASAVAWMTQYSKAYDEIFRIKGTIIDAGEVVTELLKELSEFAENDEEFHDLFSATEHVNCIPDFDDVTPLDVVFRGCLQERYKFKRLD